MEQDRQLVDEYEKLRNQQKDIEYKLEQLKAAIVSLAKQNNASFFIGTHKTCSIKTFEKVVYPENKAPFISLMKEKGLYEQFSTINYLKLGPRILKGEVDQEIMALTKKETDYRISLKDRGL